MALVSTSNPKEFLQSTTCLEVATEISKWDLFHIQSTCLLNHFLSLCLRTSKSTDGPFMITLSVAGCPIVNRVPMVTTSLSLLLFSMWSLSHLLCRNYSICPQLFYLGRNCSVQVILSAFMGGSEFKVFLHHHLGSAPPPKNGVVSNCFIPINHPTQNKVIIINVI